MVAEKKEKPKKLRRFQATKCFQTQVCRALLGSNPQSTPFCSNFSQVFRGSHSNYNSVFCSILLQLNVFPSTQHLGDCGPAVASRTLNLPKLEGVSGIFRIFPAINGWKQLWHRGYQGLCSFIFLGFSLCSYYCRCPNVRLVHYYHAYLSLNSLSLFKSDFYRISVQCNVGHISMSCLFMLWHCSISVLVLASHIYLSNK